MSFHIKWERFSNTWQTGHVHPTLGSNGLCKSQDWTQMRHFWHDNWPNCYTFHMISERWNVLLNCNLDSFASRKTLPSSQIQLYETPSWTWLWQPLRLNLRTLGLKSFSCGSRSICFLSYQASILTAWGWSPGTSLVNPTQQCKQYFPTEEWDVLGLHGAKLYFK